jgi:diguanylate cyclase (GGDEF)-like protein
MKAKAIMKTKKRATAAALPTLSRTLGQSEQVKQKVEECAETLSGVNAVLKEEMTGQLPLKRMKGALIQSKKVESKVEECVDDLSSVNAALEGEIADREKLEEQLKNSRIEEEKARYLAFHDGLTGLSNRALFDDRLNSALAQAERHHRGFALLFVDLDGFKMINDQHGHAVGDEILCAVAERLATATRKEDTVSRHGGDEFLCLLLDVDDEDQVAKIVDPIVENISVPCEFGDLRITVKSSIGIAIYPADGKTGEGLIRNADLAMYAAKKANKTDSATGYAFFSRIKKAGR